MPIVPDPTFDPAERERRQPPAGLRRESLAAWRVENLMGSALADPSFAMGNRFYEIEQGFNPFDELRERQDPFLDENAASFSDVFNRSAFEATVSALRREQEDRRVLAAGGWSAVGLSMGAGIADPTILIPGAAAVRGGRAAQIGFSTARSAALGAAAAAGATAVQEGGLQATQEFRTAGETGFAIGGSAILGGLIGGVGARFLTRAEWNEVSERLAVDLADDVPNPVDVSTTIVRRMESAGAAAVDEIDISDLDVGGPRAAQAVARATAATRLNPGVETMMSPSQEVRLVYNQMVDNPIYTRMNMDGRTLGAPVENLVKLYERGALAEWITEARRLHREARRAGYTGRWAQFNEDIALAGRRGDVDPGGNAFVTQAARLARSSVFDPLLERAQRINILPEDIQTTTAASYVTRLWNRQRLIAEEPRFRQIATRYFREQMARLPQGEGPDFVSDADLDDYIGDVVTAVFNNLTGRGRGDVPTWMVPIRRGPLKERSFMIEDEFVEEFLENDAELVLRRYTRTMGAEVELADKFGRADMRDQFDRINAEYDRLSQEATSAKERIRLDRARRRDIENLEAFRDLLRGTYRQADEASIWGQISRGTATFNYIRLLGGVTLSSLTDALRPIAVHGMRATMREALPALISGAKAVRISRADARSLGTVTERVLMSRIASMADLADPYAAGSAYERMLSNASNLFSRATGLPYWNDGWKTISAVMTQNRMARNALNWAGTSAREQSYMAFLGIDETMAGRIAAMIRAHGVEDGGIWGVNVRQWEDIEAMRAWGAALNADVDRIIVTPGVADRPLWTRSNAGRLVAQFKSFSLASHQRVLIAGLQERPHRLAEMMVAGTAMGMLVSYLKFIERGDIESAQRLLNNPGLWIADGLDRTGILTIPFEVSNTMEKLGSPVGIRSAAQAIAQDEDRGADVSRYASRNALGAVLGPTAGAFQDFITLTSQLADADLRPSGVTAGIRMIPGQSLPGVRTGLYGFVRPSLSEAVE